MTASAGPVLPRIPPSVLRPARPALAKRVVGGLVLATAVLSAACTTEPGRRAEVSIWSDAAAAQVGAAAASGSAAALPRGADADAGTDQQALAGTSRERRSASPFGVSRIGAQQRPQQQQQAAALLPGASPRQALQSDPALAPLAPIDASGGALAEQRVDLTAASLRLVDRLIEAGSQRVDDTSLPRSLLVWPIRELGTQRHTVATREATRVATERARREFRGMAPATLEAWAQGQGDWAIIAGIRWVRFVPEGPPQAAGSRPLSARHQLADAQLCGMLLDRRSRRVLAHFVQRLDPTSLDLKPAAFHADLPVVPQTSGSPLDAGLCGARPLIGEATADNGPRKPADLSTLLPGNSAVLQAIELELGLQRYEAGDYRRAAQAFGRAVDIMGNADIEALAGLAMSLERSQPARAARVWSRLAEATLGQGRVSLNGSAEGLLPSAAEAAVQQSGEAARQRAARRARLSPAGEGPRSRFLRRVSSAAALQLQADGQCALIVAHQDELEARDALRAPAYERAYATARWIALVGALDGKAIEIGNVPIEPAMIGSGTGDGADAWDRRVDVVPVNCTRDTGRL